MTRSRLTATEILHGARAYSQNASRRAHQLSGPKRVRVMHEPVGDASLNGTANSLVMRDGGRPLDGACDCGYVVCAKRGPCAPAVQPIPAPPGERDPHEAAGHPWARVGMRVRYNARGEEPGLAGAVKPYDAAKPVSPFGYIRWLGDDGAKRLTWHENLEPAPIAEAPAVESDPIADCERLGMWFTASTGGQGWNVRTDVFIAVRHFDNITDKAEAARAALLEYASRGKP
jgi:hypothetical protein